MNHYFKTFNTHSKETIITVGSPLLSEISSASYSIEPYPSVRLSRQTVYRSKKKREINDKRNFFSKRLAFFNANFSDSVKRVVT